MCLHVKVYQGIQRYACIKGIKSKRGTCIRIKGIHVAARNLQDFDCFLIASLKICYIHSANPLEQDAGW